MLTEARKGPGSGVRDDVSHRVVLEIEPMFFERALSHLALQPPCSPVLKDNVYILHYAQAKQDYIVLHDSH